MKLSLRTVQREWNLARAWLYNELECRSRLSDPYSFFMNPERWQRIEQLYHAALEREASRVRLLWRSERGR